VGEGSAVLADTNGRGELGHIGWPATGWGLDQLDGAMTPTSQDGLGAEPSRLAHANSSRERRARERRRAIVASCVMASALALGLVIVREGPPTFSTPEHAQPSADERT